MLTRQASVERTTVSTTAEFQAALRRGIDPRNIEISAPAAIAKAAAIQDERQRCKAIIELAGMENRDKAHHAIDAGTTPEAFGLELFKRLRAETVDTQERAAAVDAIAAGWQTSEDA